MSKKDVLIQQHVMKGQAAQTITSEYDAVYNCDPSSRRGYLCGGTVLEVPPLGEEGNPMIMKWGEARHIIRHSKGADLGTRGWLTMDESVFQKCVDDYAQLGYVTNPRDKRVIANEVGVKIQTEEEAEKRKAKEIDEAFEAAIESRKNAEDEKATNLPKWVECECGAKTNRKSGKCKNCDE